MARTILREPVGTRFQVGVLCVATVRSPTAAHAVRIASPTRRETVITTPHIPGLEPHLPPNTVITDHDGKVVREVSLTPIPVDQPPFPLPPGVHVPVYFTVQPGGAYVYTSGSGPKGAWLVYPNYHRQPAGAEHNFWHYDPEDRGWYVYGLGRVSADARQVVPNPGVTLYEFTGAMINFGWNPGPDGNYGPPDLDPVDLGTGAFIMDKTIGPRRRTINLKDASPTASGTCSLTTSGGTAGISRGPQLRHRS